VTLDAVHVALYAALIGAGAALLSQFVTHSITALRDARERRRRENRTRALFVAAVWTAFKPFAWLAGFVYGVRNHPSPETAMQLASRREHLERLAQPLRAALADYDLLRDLPSEAIHDLMMFDDALYWAVSVVVDQAAFLQRDAEALRDDDPRRSDAFRRCWDEVEQATVDVKNHADAAIKRLTPSYGRNVTSWLMRFRRKA
jgi:hypothetical protein